MADVEAGGAAMATRTDIYVSNFHEAKRGLTGAPGFDDVWADDRRVSRQCRAGVTLGT